MRKHKDALFAGLVGFLATVVVQAPALVSAWQAREASARAADTAAGPDAAQLASATGARLARWAERVSHN